MSAGTPPPTWHPGHDAGTPPAGPASLISYLQSGYPAPTVQHTPPPATIPADTPATTIDGHTVIEGTVAGIAVPHVPATAHPPSPPQPTSPATTATLDTRPATPRPPLAATVPRRGPNRRLLAAGAAVAVVLTAITVAVSTSARTTPPGEIVSAFYHALTTRNPEPLRDLGVCTGSPLCNRGALTDGYQPPEHPRIDPPPTANTPNLTVTVHYQLDGADHTDEVGLTRVRRGLLGYDWRISTPPGTILTLHSSYLDHARVANTDVATAAGPPPATPPPAGALPDPTAIWAPPGRYTITSSGDELVNPIRVDVTVTGPRHAQPVELQPTLRAGLDQQITRQIHDRLDQCASQPTFHPATGSSPLARDTCPFGYDAPYTITDRPHWTINSYPTIELRLEPDGTVTVATTTPGRVTLTYRWTLDILEPRTWTTATVTQPVTVAGHAVIDNNTITWTP